MTGASAFARWNKMKKTEKKPKRKKRKESVFESG
jgi:hypothetical protein